MRVVPIYDCCSLLAILEWCAEEKCDGSVYMGLRVYRCAGWFRANMKADAHGCVLWYGMTDIHVFCALSEGWFINKATGAPPSSMS